jgi:bifunctional DNase/RNase
MSHSEAEFRIRGLAPLPTDGCLVVLEEVGGARLLPIHTGSHEAQALALEASGFAPSRPLTYELLVSLLSTVGWAVKRIVVTEVKSEVFYARIFLEKDGEERSVDARPSDALNVALRARCPIFVAQSVFDQAEAILKPIAADELARFKEQLAKEDPSAAFAALEGTPAPKEPGGEGPGPA